MYISTRVLKVCIYLQRVGGEGEGRGESVWDMGVQFAGETGWFFILENPFVILGCVFLCGSEKKKNNKRVLGGLQLNLIQIQREGKGVSE